MIYNYAIHNSSFIYESFDCFVGNIENYWNSFCFHFILSLPPFQSRIHVIISNDSYSVIVWLDLSRTAQKLRMSFFLSWKSVAITFFILEKIKIMKILSTQKPLWSFSSYSLHRIFIRRTRILIFRLKSHFFHWEIISRCCVKVIILLLHVLISSGIVIWRLLTVCRLSVDFNPFEIQFRKCHLLITRLH